jgi:hypothetical protein
MFPKLSAGGDAGGLVAVQERGERKGLGGCRMPKAEAFGRCRNQGEEEDIPQGLKPPYLSRYRRPRLKPWRTWNQRQRLRQPPLVRATKREAEAARVKAGKSLEYGDLPAGVELLQNAL